MNNNWNLQRNVLSAFASNATPTFGRDSTMPSLMGLVDHSRATLGGYQVNTFSFEGQSTTGSLRPSQYNYPYPTKRSIQPQRVPQSNTVVKGNQESPNEDDSASDPEMRNSERSGNEKFMQAFSKVKQKQLRQQRKDERKRRKNELRKVRKQLRMTETLYNATPPSMVSSNVAFTTNVPGISSASQPVSVINNLPSPMNIRNKVDFFANTLRFRNVSDLLSAQVYFIKPGVESTFVFSLNTRAIQLLSEDNAKKVGYNYGVLLRISQFVDNSDVFYDLVPTTLQVLVNLEPISFNEGASLFFESPIDISELVKPLNEIKLKSQASENMNIVLGVYLVQMLTVEKAVNGYKLEFLWRPFRREKEAEAKMFANNNGSVRLSLKCPVSNKRFEVPCVGADCSHYECFDLEFFVKRHHEKFQWKCPICNQWMRNVVRDRVFSKIIENVSSTCVEVAYYQNGDRVIELAHESEIEPKAVESAIVKEENHSRFNIIEDIYIERI